jgi:hypothetical protein
MKNLQINKISDDPSLLFPKGKKAVQAIAYINNLYSSLAEPSAHTSSTARINCVLDTEKVIWEPKNLAHIFLRNLPVRMYNAIDISMLPNHYHKTYKAYQESRNTCEAIVTPYINDYKKANGHLSLRTLKPGENRLNDLDREKFLKNIGMPGNRIIELLEAEQDLKFNIEKHFTSASHVWSFYMKYAYNLNKKKRLFNIGFFHGRREKDKTFLQPGYLRLLAWLWLTGDMGKDGIVSAQIPRPVQLFFTTKVGTKKRILKNLNTRLLLSFPFHTNALFSHYEKAVEEMMKSILKHNNEEEMPDLMKRGINGGILQALSLDSQKNRIALLNWIGE